MKPETNPKRSCEAKRAEKERKTAEDDADSALEAMSAGQNEVSARCKASWTGSRTIEERPILEYMIGIEHTSKRRNPLEDQRIGGLLGIRDNPPLESLE